MINAQNLAVLLRALRQGEASPHSLPATAVVSRTMPVLALAADDASSASLRAAVDPMAGQAVRASPSPADTRLPKLAEGGVPETERRAPQPARSPSAQRFELGNNGAPAAAPPAPSSASATISFSSGASLLGAALKSAAPSELPTPVE